MLLPNIVILFVDDMGSNQVNVPIATTHNFHSYTGDNHTITTPNVARLAREGMLFQTWYSGFQVCSPSRASLMTGRLPVRVGIGMPEDAHGGAPGSPNAGGNVVLTAESIGGLPQNETSYAISTLLRDKAGYATACVGKWHLGRGYNDEYMPTNTGFDTYLGIPFSQDMGISFWRGGQDAPFKPPFFPSPVPLVDNLTIVEQPVGLHTLAAKYTARIDEFIHQNAAAKRPFFLYVPWSHIHAPNSCGPAFCNTSTRGPVGDAVQEVDWAVGEVMASIKAAGVDDNTIVFFTSDNGAPLGGDKLGNLPRRGGKASAWEGGYAEPGIVRWPGHIAPGSASTEIASTMDLLPTALALAGLDIATLLPSSRTIDGINLLPLLRGMPGAKGHECYFYYSMKGAGPVGYLVGPEKLPSGLAAVRCGAFKAHYQRKYGAKDVAHPALYDLSGDDHEQTPLTASDPRFAPAMAAIEAARTTHLASLVYVPSQNERGSDNALRFCAEPNSKAKYPTFPSCTSNPENWRPPQICGSAACLHANPQFVALCHPPPPLPCAGGAGKTKECKLVPIAAMKGCFRDHASGGLCDLPRIIDGHCHIHGSSVTNKTFGRTMTVEECNAACAFAGPYTYFGIQMGGEGCFCGDAYGSQGALSASTCAAGGGTPPAPQCRNATEKARCGGPNANSVYEIIR